MNKRATTRLTTANKLFLYELLKRELGCGKQTFLPRVEEVLGAERLLGPDLGFADTLELLGELTEFCELKLFKGGRAYATIREVPEWDEALATPASAPTGKGNKPWKKRKGAKGLKPQAPKRVRREEPAETTALEAPADVAAPVPDADAASSAATGTGAAVYATSGNLDERDEPAVADGPGPMSSGADFVSAKPKVAEEAPAVSSVGGETAARVRNEGVFELEGPASKSALASPAIERAGSATGSEGNPAAPAPAIEPTPGISITVTYDPYTGNEDETVIVAEHALHGNGVSAAAGAPEPKPRATGAEAGQPSGNGEETAVAPHSERDGSPIQPERPNLPAAAHGEQPAPTDGAARHANAAPAAAGHTTSEGLEMPSRPAPQSPTVCRDLASPDTPPSVLAIKGYPRDFSREVHLAGEVLSVLTHVLPLHSDAARALSEDFLVARGMGTVRGTRALATFPLRQAGLDGKPVTVQIEKRVGPGAAWALTAIGNIDDELLATAGIDGLPECGMGTGAVTDALRELARFMYVDGESLADAASAVDLGSWSPAELHLQLALAYLAARSQGAVAEDGKGGRYPLGLFDRSGARLEVALTATGDDIPWRLEGIMRAAAE